MRLILLNLILIAAVYADTDTLFISLGSTCGIAGLLRQYELRQAAYPFDWILSLDGEKVIEMLEDQFADFTNEQFLIPDNFLRPRANGDGLYHYKYHLEFLHDGPWYGLEYASHLEKFQSKYERRIKRFKQLNDFKGKVIFIRNNWAEQDGADLQGICMKNFDFSVDE